MKAPTFPSRLSRLAFERYVMQAASDPYHHPRLFEPHRRDPEFRALLQRRAKEVLASCPICPLCGNVKCRC